jgi:hypothetical protein
MSNLKITIGEKYLGSVVKDIIFHYPNNDMLHYSTANIFSMSTKFGKVYSVEINNPSTIMEVLFEDNTSVFLNFTTYTTVHKELD